MRPTLGLPASRWGTSGRSASVDVAHFESRPLPLRPPGPRAESRRLWVSSARGSSVHELGKLRRAEELFSAAVTGFAFTRSWGMRVSSSCVLMRSRTARSMRASPMRN